MRTRMLLAVAAAALALGAVVAVDLTRPERAAAAESETYPRPASGEWSVTGKGFGHGRGMSQWGSQGAALRGLTGSQILAFYYPGTVTTTIRAAAIRVLISGDAARGRARCASAPARPRS